MPFGQFVIGPPGSGKSTYCNGMQQFLNGIGRKVIVVNLDPANDYDCTIDIHDLISLEPVMENLKLGPNGGLLYCMEYLKEHLNDWLIKQIKPYIEDKYYVIFDLPGQIELYTHYDAIRVITETLVKELHFQLCVVNLVDAHHCSDASKFISVLMISLSMMIRLELPHVNILSKVDLIQQYGELDFDIDFYTNVQDLNYLVQTIRKKKKNEEEEEEEENEDRFRKLNYLLASVIEDYSLVSFLTLNIQDKDSVYNVLKVIDKANGYVFGACEKDNTSIMDIAAKELSWAYEANDDVRRKYIHKEE
ncbi:hypothetical protein ABK040_000103 [Willaertia magna]